MSEAEPSTLFTRYTEEVSQMLWGEMPKHEAVERKQKSEPEHQKPAAWLYRTWEGDTEYSVCLHDPAEFRDPAILDVHPLYTHPPKHEDDEPVIEGSAARFIEREALDIYTRMVNSGASLQATLAAVYISGMSAANSAMRGEGE